MNNTATNTMLLGVKFVPKFISIFTKFGLLASSFVVYSYLFTWQFSVMLLLALFVHEYGHVVDMKRHGMKVKGIYFIPLLGGAAVAEKAFPSRAAETHIALWGPLYGTSLALFSLLWYYLTNQTMFAAAAGIMAAFNLFNLLPINPLDGGRVFKSISFSLHTGIGMALLLLCFLISICLAFSVNSSLLYIFITVGGAELFLEWRRNYGIGKELKRYEEFDEVMKEIPFSTYPLIAKTLEDSSDNEPIKLPIQEEGDASGLVVELIRAYPQVVENKINYLHKEQGSLNPSSPMTKMDILRSVGLYLAIAAALLWIILASAKVPGSDLARHLLLDGQTASGAVTQVGSQAAPPTLQVVVNESGHLMYIFLMVALKVGAVLMGVLLLLLPIALINARLDRIKLHISLCRFIALGLCLKEQEDGLPPGTWRLERVTKVSVRRMFWQFWRPLESTIQARELVTP